MWLYPFEHTHNLFLFLFSEGPTFDTLVTAVNYDGKFKELDTGFQPPLILANQI